jgi:hypothetical protein
MYQRIFYDTEWNSSSEKIRGKDTAAKKIRGKYGF